MDDLNNCSQEELLKIIMQYKFYINDLALYLDTHAQDFKTLELHNEYTEKLKSAMKIYESKYEPLTIETVMESWEWSQDLWPWERGFYK